MEPAYYKLKPLRPQAKHFVRCFVTVMKGDWHRGLQRNGDIFILNTMACTKNSQLILWTYTLKKEKTSKHLPLKS
jgi:hypothetical protein